MQHLQCRSRIRELLKQGVQLALSSQLKGMPNVAGEFLHDYTDLYFLLGKQTAGLYVQAMNELRIELVPSRAKDEEVIKALWELFDEVVSNPTAYLGKDKLRERLNEFEQLWEAPLTRFRIAYSVDYLDLGAAVISIGPVTFRTAGKDTLAEWGIDAMTKSWSADDPRVGSRSIAYTQVEAAHHRLAFDTGKPLVLDAISILQLAALKGLENRAEPDQLLQWRLNGHSVVRAADSEVKGYSVDYHRPFRPSVMDLSKTVTSGLDSLAVNDLLISALPSDIRERLLRGVQWISHSVTHEGHDHKLVDLCTSLEVMLLPNYRGGKKGELIAVRYNLFGGALNPAAVKEFYDLRSAVVHGAAVNIVGALDTWHVRLLCHTVLDRLIQEAKSNPKITTLEQLIMAKESPVRLADFINRCKTGIYDGTGISAIRKVAESRLKQAFQTS